MRSLCSDLRGFLSFDGWERDDVDSRASSSSVAIETSVRECFLLATLFLAHPRQCLTCPG